MSITSTRPRGGAAAAPRVIPPRGAEQERHLARERRRLWDKSAGAVVRMHDYRVRISDGPNAYMQYKDVFVRGIYRFTADRPSPLVIDGGSNMGVSILGFRNACADARVIGFEPDDALHALTLENLKRNGITDGVTLVNAGLAAEAGEASFAPDGSAGGQVGGEASDAAMTTIRVERLSEHLNEEVDFLKLNIEGQELPVLREAEASGRLRNVRRAVVEYHGWAGRAQQLGDLLNLFDRNGFRYLVHDFDTETCGITKPPFRHRPKANWFCLVYAERLA